MLTVSETRKVGSCPDNFACPCPDESYLFIFLLPEKSVSKLSGSLKVQINLVDERDEWLKKRPLYFLSDMTKERIKQVQMLYHSVAAATQFLLPVIK